eukprot:jgi/Chlat1/3835/Chrsp26S08839
MGSAYATAPTLSALQARLHRQAAIDHSVMLAESVHSFADLANQCLLAVGIHRSRRKPDRRHPYGYSRERFIWSLISAVGIFCLGSGVSIVHGIHGLFEPEPLENMVMLFGVLGASAVVEGYSLRVGLQAVQAGAAAEKMTLLQFLRTSRDPMAVAVLMEDSAAVLGLGVAAACLTAVHMTGNPIWDPAGSIMVGTLLAGVATFLIQRNSSALLGMSMDVKDVERVLAFLHADPVVHAVYDTKSEIIGPGEYRFKAEIDFSGTAVVQNYLQRTGKHRMYSKVGLALVVAQLLHQHCDEAQNYYSRMQMRDATAAKDDAALERLVKEYGEAMVTALGDEVDRLEREIQRLVPGITHVDIETHSRTAPVPDDSSTDPYYQMKLPKKAAVL